eukprot:TRINITY_DN7288_c0_g1_i5.p1 TRINITY_DN7288_c0_g1~~TRINITY_DN7288_c0_g1_i5.p1  ORF type:complete len:242 (+),score=48.24 TRINITY_DN7288_c0_g1_i5:189-914(+)
MVFGFLTSCSEICTTPASQQRRDLVADTPRLSDRKGSRLAPMFKSMIEAEQASARSRTPRSPSPSEDLSNKRGFHSPRSPKDVRCHKGGYAASPCRAEDGRDQRDCDALSSPRKPMQQDSCDKRDYEDLRDYVSIPDKEDLSSENVDHCSDSTKASGVRRLSSGGSLESDDTLLRMSTVISWRDHKQGGNLEDVLEFECTEPEPELGVSDGDAAAAQKIPAGYGLPEERAAEKSGASSIRQ